ncbi:MAG: pseudouridine synthase [Verrucomicrobiota bacterium]
MRINRYLASAGLGSRRACEQLVLEGQVKINGKTVSDLATRVTPDDTVTVAGDEVATEERLVLAMNKPAGYICSREDLENRRTIFDLLPQSGPRLFYVGRLDKESEGLLIVTNDGDLCQQLSHPSKKVPKTYEVGVLPKFDKAAIPKFLKGMHIEPGFAKAEEVHQIHDFLVKVVLKQGLKRQIRLMFSQLGYKVKHLKRTQIGGLHLGKLKPGAFRRLTDKDLKKILEEPKNR